MAAGDITAVRSKASDVYSAASFDGVDDRVDIPHHASQLGANLSNGFTISAWIYLDSYGENNLGRILDKSTGSLSQDGFRLFVNNSGGLKTLVFSINNGGNKTSANNAMLLNRWYHTLVTISPVQLLNIYVDNVLSGAANQDLVQPISAITTTNGLTIGNLTTDTTFTFDGCIKDVKMWSRVLTADEIALDYAGTNVSNGQILWVPLKDDYMDKSTLGLTGTNSGTYLTNTLTNKIKADTRKGLNLGAATDKIIALPRRGSPTIITAKRAAA